MAFTIKTQEEFNECLLWISDLSKDAYGFRIRGIDWAAMSFDELAAEVNRMSEIAEIAWASTEEEAREAAEAEEMAILKVMECGADRETAMRWLAEAQWAA